jgi:tetratricopeptide (TPR) repeat protein
VPVPATVHDVLTARIDRLPEGAKRVLQVGSVMGREFSWELVQAVAERPEPELVAHIEALTDAELVYERGVPPEATYLFKHALTQDVAYESLLLTTRNELHQKVAEAILGRYGDDLDEWAGPLGHHFAHSERPEQALPYLVKTGERAVRVYANAEAIASFSQALEILDALPATEITSRQRADLSVQLGSLHALLGHYGESQALFERALAEARSTGDLKIAARLESRIGRVRYSMGDNEGAIACFERALDLAKRIQDPARMAICYQGLGAVHNSSGSLMKAVESFASALRLAEEAGNRTGEAVACWLLADAHERAGHLREALQWGRRAVSVAENLNDERRMAWACVMLARTLMYLGEFAEADRFAEKALHLSEKTGDFRAKLWVISGYGAERAALERDFERELESAIHAIRASEESGGIQHEAAFAFARAAEAHLRLGHQLDALECCEQGLAIARRMSNNKLEYGYAFMVLAEIHTSQPHRDREKSASYLEESLSAFSEVGARIEQGRAHLAGARIAVAFGDKTARECAETARSIFAEQGCKPLLEEAEELLASLE